jgi:aminotransferase|tara:strand:- start:1078 stop:2244 length:1167 start_codon:yes stop_codon:yes gene_type:complete
MSVVYDRSKIISLDDESFRSELLGIASKMDDVIPLGRGDPDFHTPKHIVEAAKKALDENKHHYTPPNGLPELRNAISKNFKEKYSLDYNIDEIVVTAGVQESIALAMLSLLERDDEVLITSPRFTTYDLTVRMCNAIPVPIPTYEKNNFALMPDIIEQKITNKTKLIVLVSPNNPTGAVTPPENIKKIADIAIKHNLIVIADEIYADLIYENHEHLSIGTLENMKERTLTLNGFSKTYAMTGWRIGYIAGPEDIAVKMSEIRHSLSINSCTFSQYGALAALEGPQEEIIKMKEEYNLRRKFCMRALDEIGFTYGDPGGAFYIYTNVSKSGLSASNFCKKLLENTGVLLFPGTLFGDEEDKYIRLSYLQPIEKIQESMKRIKGFINEHK